MKASARSTTSAASATPLARATASTSRMASASSASVAGSSRIGPTARRVRHVTALNAARVTNFAHSAASMSPVMSQSTPARRNAARNASARGLTAPSNSPKASRATVSPWRITPGRSITDGM